MSSGFTSTPLFGDALALARQSWVREMASRLADHGFDDYRVSDALALRWLAHHALPFATFTSSLGVSRQNARKVVDGLVERSFAVIEADPVDARRRNVRLTTKGDAYATAVIDTLHTLNDELSEKIDPLQLDAAISVLKYVRNNFGT